MRERFHYLTILLVVYEDKLVVIPSLITWWLRIVVSGTMYDNHLEIRAPSDCSVKYLFGETKIA